ncbi:rhamnosyltransferase WsaF family glycosyltransferase [Enterovibrio norvegicus]|uniref:rhamnosyltransferase WsaF family glycosyltransferase n=1 Tax=Enterovibrio norvegicus TaxID=188144 RepID=UPI001E590E06|nr:glycosyltransferase [Enterovibrio norvegicus]MCC4801061.1 glycosyltransferase [Enterovibrio norvegicus]
MINVFKGLMFKKAAKEQKSKYESLCLSHYVSHAEFNIIENLFDELFYLEKYQDVANSGIEPIYHYIVFGRVELRNPNKWFDAAFYKNKYLDLKESNIDLLVHYHIAGSKEGRVPNSLLLVDKEKKIEDKPVEKNVLDFLCPDLAALSEFKRIDLCPETDFFYEDELKIHFVIPDFGIGGGGHMNIFRMLSYFEISGHKVTIWIFNPHHNSEISAYENMVKNYNFLNAKVKFVDDSFSEAKGDVIFATSWDTVWPVNSVVNFKRRFYFIQDFEPSFYPVGSKSVLAESTYKMGLDTICASNWLKTMMESKYQSWSEGFNLAADRDIFYPIADRKNNEQPKIVFYARNHTQRRAVELGFIALDLLAKDGFEFSVECFGMEKPLNSYTNFPCEFNPSLSPEELAEKYRNADIGMVFSLTNYSLVPQEMMACGLPIVEFDCESTRAIYPENCVTFAGPEPKSIKSALIKLLDSSEIRSEQSKFALDWVGRFSWRQSADHVENAITNRLKDVGFKSRNKNKSKGKVKASIVIPTLNGGFLFKDVLNKVRSQIAPWNYEIIVIDSGSTDGTIEYLNSFDDVFVHRIEKSDFNHGATRNLGVELSKGDFVAFITQDAIPLNNKWLYNLVSAVERDPMAAGAFGRHVAHDNADPFTKFEIYSHFSSLSNYPLSLNREIKKPYELSEEQWSGILRYYSDNNSCLRKSAWSLVPYKPVKYGEDQIWGGDVIKQGFVKVYAIDAVVKHSHDYDFIETFDRAEIDGDYFKFFFDTNLVDEANVEGTIESLNNRDSEFGKKIGLTDDEISVRFKLNEAKIQGYLSGQKKNVSLFSDECTERSKF